MAAKLRQVHEVDVAVRLADVPATAQPLGLKPANVILQELADAAPDASF